MKLHRILTLVLVAGATIFALASCGKTTSVTSANVVEQAPLVAPDGVADTYYPGIVRDVLKWNLTSSARVAGYEVFMATSNPATGGVAHCIATPSAKTGQLVLTDVTTDCVQYYQIRCAASDGTKSPFSAPIAVQRHAPTSTDNNGGGGSGPVGGGSKISD